MLQCSTCWWKNVCALMTLGGWGWGWGCNCVERGDIYSIPTKYPLSLRKTEDVNKSGGSVSDQPTGRYTVPTVHLKSRAERIRSVLNY